MQTTGIIRGLRGKKGGILPFLREIETDRQSNLEVFAQQI